MISRIKTILWAVWMLGVPALCSCGRNSGAAAESKYMERLADTIAAIVAGYPGETGVAVIVNNIDTVAVNNQCKYPMMSVFKMHQALAVCKELDECGISLDTVLTIRRSDLDPDTWSPMLKDHADAEFGLSVGELLRYTLAQSDNNASNLMFGRIAGVAPTDSFVATVIPRESFRIAYTEAEMSADHDRAYANSTSPLGAAILINRLYTDSLVSPEKQAFVAQTLRECRTGTDRIVAPLLGVPGVSVGHKTGSGYTTGEGVLVAHNDVAYVVLPDGTSYALAVFVKDFHGNEAEAAQVIARISAAVYGMLSGERD